MTREVRSFDVEVRAVGGEQPKLEGIALRYGVRSRDLGGFVETIAPGAVTASLRSGRDIPALMFHDATKILGRTSKGTLELRDTPEGLAFTIYPGNTSVGRDSLEMTRRGDVPGMSFGFRSIEDRWTREGNVRVRELRNIELLDISLAGTPAYPDTSVALRSLEAWQSTNDPDEMCLFEMELRRRQLGGRYVYDA